MKAQIRTLWLVTLGVLFSGGALGGGEGTAPKGTRTCTLKGAWRDTSNETISKFEVGGDLLKSGDGDSFLGSYIGKRTDGVVSGKGENGHWEFSFRVQDIDHATTTTMTIVAIGDEQETDRAKEFKVKGTYEASEQTEDFDTSGSVTLSGTCSKS